MENSLKNRLRAMVVQWRRAPSVAPEAPQQLEEPTPIFISQLTRSVILIAAFIALIALGRAVPSVLSTILIGATVALILSFPVRFLQRFFPRKIAIIVVTVGMILTAIISLGLLIPFLINEITRFISSLPATMESLTEFLEDVLGNAYERGWIDKRPEAIIEDAKAGTLDATQTVLTSIMDDVVTTLSSSVSMFISVFGVIFVSIYFLADIGSFKNTYLRMWAPDYRKDALVLWDTIGYSLSRYLGGLAFSLTIQGVMAVIGLSLLGVPYAIFLGLVVSVTAILPYIGAWISLIPAVLVALTISWQTAVGVCLLYLAINQLEGNLITPRVQGSAVKVHPILIFFGVIGGSRLFGPLGAIMAVPIIAVLRVVLEFFWLRVRVNEDRPTLFAAMRNDSVDERIDFQGELAEDMEDAKDDVTDEEIEELTDDPDDQYDNLR